MDTQTVLLRLVIATLLGGVIGIERETSLKPAGLRTHMMVSLGCALFMLVSMQSRQIFGNADGIVDPSRMAAQILAGIGFLGAGTILQARGSVHGLTTAATIWTVAAIGVAVAGGFYHGAIATTALAFAILWLVEKVERLFGFGGKLVKLRVLAAEAERIVELQEILTHQVTSIQKVNVLRADGSVTYSLEVLMDRRRLPLLTAELRAVPGIQQVDAE
jgi:putative Mg2+ transporter-C (MgtC) family protein